MITAVEFAQVYDQYSDHIFRHCYFRVYNRDRAKELMQDVFLRAWKYNVEGHGIMNIRALLYKIANNLIIDESRKKKDLYLEELEQPMQNSQGGEPGPRHEIGHIDERVTLHEKIDGSFTMAFLDTLESQDRDIIVMRFIDGLSPREIAELTGETANVISVRIHRAIRRLRTHMPANYL